MSTGYLSKAIDAYLDWPRPSRVFYQQCADCDDELFADTPVYYDPDADCVGDPPQYVDRSLWLCVPCAEARGYFRNGGTT